ncbi:MAG: helix-turn-helix transcriptional regulator [Alphaproteobacteria bacterium]|nr:helix-turn-helix transcriptional regulator [Alphaproteobacteria bacterium]
MTNLANRLENIGLNIRKYRKKMKLSQVDLAVEVGIDRSYLSEIENGRVNPTINILYAIADSLNVSVVNLLIEEK